MIRYLTAGESHGEALVGIVEGMPAGVPLTAADLDEHLARRWLGYGRGGRAKIEQDRVHLYSGVRFSRTLGSPIALRLDNAAYRKDRAGWPEKMAVEGTGEGIEKVTLPRPGHADLVGVQKYGFDDIRPVIDRASARETAMRVACCSIARQLLRGFGIEVGSHVVRIGEVGYDAPEDWADRVQSVVVTGVPPGLGSYVHWDRKLDGQLAQAVLSIQAQKAVEIGDGFAGGRRPGSAFHDPITKEGGQFRRASNHAGGIEGGVSNGMPIVVRGTMKPIPTLIQPLMSVDLATGEPQPTRYERSDVTSVPAASTVAEATVALVIANALLERFGGDTFEAIRERLGAA
jgi:chorismate synthase